MDEIVNNRICPDSEKLKNLGGGWNWNVKGAYGNVEERKSFFIEMTLCKIGVSRNPNCKQEAQVVDLLTEVFFTIYHSKGRADLKTPDHTAKPVSI